MDTLLAMVDALAQQLQQAQAQLAAVQQEPDEPFEPILWKAAPPKRHPWDEPQE